MSWLENGRSAGFAGAIERVAAALEVRLELTGRWRGGDGERLLNWRHSTLAESVSAAVRELRLDRGAGSVVFDLR